MLPNAPTTKFCFVSPNSVASGAHCVKVVEDIPKLSATEI